MQDELTTRKRGDISASWVGMQEIMDKVSPDNISKSKLSAEDNPTIVAWLQIQSQGSPDS